MKLKKNIQMRDYTQVNGYADEKANFIYKLKGGTKSMVKVITLPFNEWQKYKMINIILHQN